MTMQRRHFLMTPPALALGAAAAAAPIATLAAPTIMTPQSRILPRTGKGPRIVICGGGWGGMTAARYLRELIPDSDVVLLERNPTFWSGPMSNKWLIDIVNTDFVNRDMLHPANKYGYQLLQTEVTGFERDKKLVRTAHGLIEYDYLILSGGIRNDYEAWFGNDQKAIESWLATKSGSPHTSRAYRKEAERLILWAIVERGRALSSLTTEDAIAYRAFLRHPGPRARWVAADSCSDSQAFTAW